MSISSSLYTGMSSLFCLGEKVNTLGDNIANVNTTGFRANQLNFEDILFESTHSGGVKFNKNGVTSNFSSEGSMQSSPVATHMAISGDGFFILSDEEDTDSAYYTRAGEFTFDAEGYLRNPGDYIVQGYQFGGDGSEGTSLTDIQLNLIAPPATVDSPDPVPRLVSAPSASTKITLITNVDTRSEDNSPAADDWGLFSNWDATNAEPLGSSDYEHRADHFLYDDSGDRHSIAVYYDKTSQDSVWEYLVTAPPEDPQPASPKDGVLARGTITFSGNGYIEDMTLDNYQSGAWTAGTANNNGYHSFSTSFSGAGSIELDMGANEVNGIWQHASQSSTQFGLGSYTTFSNTDGYGEGDLTAFSVTTDGIIRASFDNGVTSDLYRVGLANANDPSSRLKRIGNSLFRTKADPSDEGGGIEDLEDNIPGESGLGRIMGSSLESSNVDLTEQFGDLIFTQRAFQANSKSMVAADEMLQTLIALSR